MHLLIYLAKEREKTMNRTAQCIRMLTLLNSRGLLSRADLAELLDTNIRNIPEFKHELEAAGYSFENTPGRYGGYRLKNESVIPMLQLSDGERDALSESISYLSSHSDFLPLENYVSAIDKVRGAARSNSNSSSILFKSNSASLSKRMRTMIALCESCRDHLQTMEIEYKSMRSSNYKKIRLHPYELLNVKGSYYVLGYNADIHEFRVYKFSDARMLSANAISQYFTRDIDFDIKEHIGQTGLMKDDLHEIDCVISGDLALLIYESEIGINSQKEWLDEKVLHLKTIIEGKMEATRFLLSLGASCKVIEPAELKEEIKEQLNIMIKQY